MYSDFKGKKVLILSFLYFIENYFPIIQLQGKRKYYCFIYILNLRSNNVVNKYKYIWRKLYKINTYIYCIVKLCFTLDSLETQILF